MKKLILFALFLNAALLAGRLVQDMAANAQGGEARGNGDVNGDGMRDISDASYLLGWLLLGGPAPVALADSPQLELRVLELEKAVAGLQTSQPTVAQVAAELAANHADALRGERGPPGEPGVGSDPVAAAVDSLALLLGDAQIADGVPTSALQPLDRSQPFTLFLNGEAFGDVVGLSIDEEVSSLPLAHVAVRIDATVMDTDPLLGLPARLDFQQQDRLTHFAGEVTAAGFAGREGRSGIVRLSIAPRLSDAGSDARRHRRSDRRLELRRLHQQRPVLAHRQRLRVHGDRKIDTGPSWLWPRQCLAG